MTASRSVRTPLAVATRGHAWVRGLAAVLCFAAAPSVVLAQGGPARVEVDRVSTVMLSEKQPVLGRLVATRESLIASRIPGIVDAIHVRIGDQVTKGQDLADLDRELLDIEAETAEATLVQAQALLNAATASVALAKQSFDRVSGLQGSAAFSQGRFDDLSQELERARALYAEAEAKSAASRAGVATAKYRLKNATIEAPFDGVVIARDAEPGEYLSVGAPVLTLIDSLNLEIEADVPTEVIGGLDLGGSVAFTLDDGTRHTATVRAVVPNETPTTRTRPVRFAPEFADTAKPLAAGQTATLEIPVGQPREVVSVAKDAVVQQMGGWIVFVAEDGKATPRPVEIGDAADGRFKVSGLEPGEIVVVRGNERLRPGQPIAFDPPPAGDEAGERTARATGEPAESTAAATN